jgi:uncharacterized protein (DUF4415 family)
VKNENLVRYTADELRKMPSRTDMDKVRATTEEDILRHMAEDDDLDSLNLDWSKAIAVQGLGKKAISIRLDQDVVDFFKAQGNGYQSRMNRVLRHYMESVGKSIG